MALRAVWKGFLKIGAVSCSIKLINAASDAERVSFRILNRKDRLPVKAVYVDEVTGETVTSGDEMKGYELPSGEYLLLEPEEIRQLKPSAERLVEVTETVDISSIDQRYFDKPYYVVPADTLSEEPFAVVQNALARKAAAACASIVLYQRGREVVIAPHRDRLLMMTLRNATDIVAADEILDEVNEPEVDKEMVEIATLLIDKKAGKFDPSKFEDRYEQALIRMIEAKKAGKKPPSPIRAPRENVVDLAGILRKSLAKEGVTTGKTRKTATTKRKSAA